MQEIETHLPPPHEEAGLLDILLTLAENAKLLILVPLFVGLCALGISYVLPQTFESVAVLQADQSIANIISSDAVLDPVVAKFGLGKGVSAVEARLQLRQSVKTSVGRADKQLTLAVSASTPQQAQAIATALIEQTYLQSRPKGVELARLEEQLARAEGRLRMSENTATAMLRRFEARPLSAGSGILSERGDSYSELQGAILSTQALVSVLANHLDGFLISDQLVQSPSLPDKASRPQKAKLAVSGTLASGLLLLLFVFIRQALRNSAARPEVADKLARIRLALGLR